MDQVKPKPVEVNQEMLQRNIEAQLGGLTVQCCIKDAIIEQLQAENQMLKDSIAKLAVPTPNGERHGRPVSGQTEGEKR